jgi:hypothetical protein
MPPDAGSSEAGKMSEPMFWDRVRDGFSMPLSVGYACEVIKYYKNENSGFEFKVGYQGKIIELQNDDGYWARIGIPGLDRPIDIPKFCLQGGTVPWDSQWTVDTNLFVSTVQLPSTFRQDSQDQLAKAINVFLQALLKSGAPFIGNQVTSLLGGEIGSNIKTLTDIVIAGVQRAGLLHLLNQKDFTLNTMVSNATFTIDKNYPQGEGGIYFRRYKDPEGQYHVYIGKARDFRKRFDHYKQKSTGRYHDSLQNRPGTTLSMHVLSFLPQDNPPIFYFLCEQVFVSLFETYKPDIFRLDASILVDRPSYMNHVESAQYMREVAIAAALVSRWPGGTSRDSFGCKFGVNQSSPLAEAAWEKSLWIRTDAVMEIRTEEGTGMEFVPVANFRRTTPRVLTHIVPQKKGFQLGVLELIIHQKHYEGHHNIAFRPYVDKVDGFVAPKKNDALQLVFEVRLDGKPHPRSWARLPRVGPFMNWSIADSWALRIEWKDPNGEWKYRYCQSVTQQRIEDTTSGTLDTYVHGAGIIHFLFQKPLGFRTAITDLGFARVRQINYDYMRKRISFIDQKPYPNALDARRKPADAIIQEMKNSEFQLQGINIPFGSMPQTGSRRYWRTKCDTCVLAEGGKDKEKCVEKLGSGYNVCNNCYDIYGRPCCSWTPDIYNRQAFVRGTATAPNRVRITETVTRTLVIKPRAESTNPSYDPQLQEIFSTVPEEQEMSKEELEEEWGGILDDELAPMDGEW